MAKKWNPLLHPRDRKGRFIRKFGIVKWLNSLTGTWEYGQATGVESINGQDVINVTPVKNLLGTKTGAPDISLPSSKLYVANTPKAYLWDKAMKKKIGAQAGSNPGGLYTVPAVVSKDSKVPTAPQPIDVAPEITQLMDKKLGTGEVATATINGVGITRVGSTYTVKSETGGAWIVADPDPIGLQRAVNAPSPSEGDTVPFHGAQPPKVADGWKHPKTGQNRRYVNNWKSFMSDPAGVSGKAWLNDDDEIHIDYLKGEDSAVAKAVLADALRDYGVIKGAPGGEGEGEGEDGDAPETEAKFYVKQAKTIAHGKNEMLANALYTEAGVPVPEVHYDEDDGNIYSKIVDGNHDMSTKLSQGDQEWIAAVQNDFAVDAWLGNRDVFGMTNDNILTDANNVPYRIDNGGALLFRAQGAKKTDFDSKVTELDVFRKGKKAKIYGSTMQKEREIDGAQRVLAITPQRIEEMVAESGLPKSLADTLKARRKYIADYYGLPLPETMQPPGAPEKTTAPLVDAPDIAKAGTLPRNWTKKFDSMAAVLLVAEPGDSIRTGKGAVFPYEGVLTPGLNTLLTMDGGPYQVKKSFEGKRPKHGEVWTAADASNIGNFAWERGDHLVIGDIELDVIGVNRAFGAVVYEDEAGNLQALPFSGIKDAVEVKRWDPPALPDEEFVPSEKGGMAAAVAEDLKAELDIPLPDNGPPPQPPASEGAVDDTNNGIGTGTKKMVLGDGTEAKTGDKVVHKNGSEFVFVKPKGPYAVVTDPNGPDPDKQLLKKATVLSQPGVDPVADPLADPKTTAAIPKSKNGFIPEVGMMAKAKDGTTGPITMVSPDGKFVFIDGGGGGKPKRKSTGAVDILDNGNVGLADWEKALLEPGTPSAGTAGEGILGKDYVSSHAVTNTDAFKGTPGSFFKSKEGLKATDIVVVENVPGQLSYEKWNNQPESALFTENGQVLVAADKLPKYNSYEMGKSPLFTFRIDDLPPLDEAYAGYTLLHNNVIYSRAQNWPAGVVYHHPSEKFYQLPLDTEVGAFWNGYPPADVVPTGDLPPLPGILAHGNYDNANGEFTTLADMQSAGTLQAGNFLSYNGETWHEITAITNYSTTVALDNGVHLPIYQGYGTAPTYMVKTTGAAFKEPASIGAWTKDPQDASLAKAQIDAALGALDDEGKKSLFEGITADVHSPIMFDNETKTFFRSDGSYFNNETKSWYPKGSGYSAKHLPTVFYPGTPQTNLDGDGDPYYTLPNSKTIVYPTDTTQIMYGLYPGNTLGSSALQPAESYGDLYPALFYREWDFPYGVWKKAGSGFEYNYSTLKKNLVYSHNVHGPELTEGDQYNATYIGDAYFPPNVPLYSLVDSTGVEIGHVSQDSFGTWSFYLPNGQYSSYQGQWIDQNSGVEMVHVSGPEVDDPEGFFYTTGGTPKTEPEPETPSAPTLLNGTSEGDLVYQSIASPTLLWLKKADGTWLVSTNKDYVEWQPNTQYDVLDIDSAVNSYEFKLIQGTKAPADDATPAVPTPDPAHALLGMHKLSNAYSYTFWDDGSHFELGDTYQSLSGWSLPAGTTLWVDTAEGAGYTHHPKSGWSKLAGSSSAMSQVSTPPAGLREVNILNPVDITVPDKDISQDLPLYNSMSPVTKASEIVPGAILANKLKFFGYANYYQVEAAPDSDGTVQISAAWTVKSDGTTTAFTPYPIAASHMIDHGYVVSSPATDAPAAADPVTAEDVYAAVKASENLVPMSQLLPTPGDWAVVRYDGVDHVLKVKEVGSDNFTASEGYVYGGSGTSTPVVGLSTASWKIGDTNYAKAYVYKNPVPDPLPDSQPVVKHEFVPDGYADGVHVQDLSQSLGKGDIFIPDAATHKTAYLVENTTSGAAVLSKKGWATNGLDWFEASQLDGSMLSVYTGGKSGIVYKAPVAEMSPPPDVETFTSIDLDVATANAKAGDLLSYSGQIFMWGDGPTTKKGIWTTVPISHIWNPDENKWDEYTLNSITLPPSGNTVMMAGSVLDAKPVPFPEEPKDDKIPGYTYPTEEEITAWGGSTTKDGFIPYPGMAVTGKGPMVGKVIAVSKDKTKATVLTSEGKKTTRLISALKSDKVSNYKAHLGPVEPKEIPEGMVVPYDSPSTVFEKVFADTSHIGGLINGHAGIKNAATVVKSAKAPNGKKYARVHFTLTSEQRTQLMSFLEGNGEPPKMGAWVKSGAKPLTELAVGDVVALRNSSSQKEWVLNKNGTAPTHRLVEIQPDGTHVFEDVESGAQVTTPFTKKSSSTQVPYQVELFTWDETKPAPLPPATPGKQFKGLSAQAKALGWQWSSSNSIIPSANASAGTISANPSDWPSNSQVNALNGGAKLQLADGVVVDVVAPHVQKHSEAGVVVISIPEGGDSVAAYSSALSALQMDHVPLTKETVKAQVRPLLVNMLSLDMSAPDSSKGWSDEKIFSEIGKEIGIPDVGWDDVRISVDQGQGRTEFLWSDRVINAMVKASSWKNIVRGGKTPSKVVDVVKYGAMDATTRRVLGLPGAGNGHGTDSSNNAGHGSFMSGGSPSKFVPKNPINTSYGGGYGVYHRPEALFARIGDIRPGKGSSDVFGAGAGNGSSAFKGMLNQASSWDLWMAGGLPNDTIGYIVMKTEADRSAVLKQLKADGITELGGRPLEEVIQTAAALNGKHPSDLPPYSPATNAVDLSSLPD